jgi:hypothetical protein
MRSVGDSIITASKKSHPDATVLARQNCNNEMSGYWRLSLYRGSAMPRASVTINIYVDPKAIENATGEAPNPQPRNFALEIDQPLRSFHNHVRQGRLMWSDTD